MGLFFDMVMEKLAYGDVDLFRPQSMGKTLAPKVGLPPRSPMLKSNYIGVRKTPPIAQDKVKVPKLRVKVPRMVDTTNNPTLRRPPRIVQKNPTNLRMPKVREKAPGGEQRPGPNQID